MQGTQMSGLRRTDGIVFGPVRSRKTSYKRPCGCFRISLAKEMATNPEGEFALLSRKKKKRQEAGAVFRQSQWQTEKVLQSQGKSGYLNLGIAWSYLAE